MLRRQSTKDFSLIHYRNEGEEVKHIFSKEKNAKVRVDTSA